MTGKNHNKRLKAHTSYHPPPENGSKKELINDSAKWGCRRRKVSTYKHPPPLIQNNGSYKRSINTNQRSVGSYHRYRRSRIMEDQPTGLGSP